MSLPPSPSPSNPPATAGRLISCAGCSVRGSCLPAALDADDLARLGTIVDEQRVVQKGDHLFRCGDRFDAVYALRSGSVKTELPAQAAEGHQVTGLWMTGDLVGTTGIHSGTHTCDAIALEETQFCAFDLRRLAKLCRQSPALQRETYRCMSRQLVQGQKMHRLLAKASAEERVAEFLHDFAQRQHALGASADELILSMSREDIANLLGLRIETVSRCLSRLQGDGTLAVHGRRISVLDRDQLRDIARGTAATEIRPAAQP